LTVQHPGEKKAVDIILTRSVIRVKTVKHERKGDVGYIRITSFAEKTNASLKGAVATLKTQRGAGLKGYVIDLRNDPGGLLNQAIAVSGDFLNGGEVVSTRGRRQADTQRYEAHGRDITDGKPIVVLINEGTASAAEIVPGRFRITAAPLSACLLRKGLVSDDHPVARKGERSASSYDREMHTPSGRSILATGITPDIAVSNLTKKEQAKPISRGRAVRHRSPAHLDAEGAKRNTGAHYPARRRKEVRRFSAFLCT
jgi:carboxyl-terminal processing protease